MFRRDRLRNTYFNELPVELLNKVEDIVMHQDILCEYELPDGMEFGLAPRPS